MSSMYGIITICFVFIPKFWSQCDFQDTSCTNAFIMTVHPKDCVPKEKKVRVFVRILKMIYFRGGRSVKIK